jgi:predicted RNase H-like HicB family nuclease
MRIIFTALIRGEAEGGYSVLCPELSVASQGETMEEVDCSYPRRRIRIRSNV